MKKISILLVMIMATFAIQAQVAINKDGSAPNASTILHVKNTSGSQFKFSDTDGVIKLQSHESSDVYVGKAYMEFGNSNGGFHSVGTIGKDAGNSNLSIFSDIGLYFSFTSGSAHRLTGYGLGLGKTVPSEMLDVVGNGKFTGTLDAGGAITSGADITANGDLWGTNGYLTDNLDVGGTGNFGDVVNIAQSTSISGLTITGTNHAAIDLSSTSSGNTYRLTSTSSGNFYIHGLGGATNNSLMIDPSGNIYGIANISSGAKIQVGTEVNRTAQGAADLIPIAYGIVNSDGTIANAGTGNWTSTWNGSFYEITITGENFYYNSYIVNATNIGGPAMSCSYGSVNNNLVISPKNSSGTVVQDNFSFIVYKP